MNPEERFPLLGFPNEDNTPRDEIVYTAKLAPDARIVLWRWKQPDVKRRPYALNLYRDRYTDGMADYADRFDKRLEPIEVNDALEAQCVIFHLIQKYLPTEATP